MKLLVLVSITALAYAAPTQVVVDNWAELKSAVGDATPSSSTATEIVLSSAFEAGEYPGTIVVEGTGFEDADGNYLGQQYNTSHVGQQIQVGKNIIIRGNGKVLDSSEWEDHNSKQVTCHGSDSGDACHSDIGGSIIRLNGRKGMSRCDRGLTNCCTNWGRSVICRAAELRRSHTKLAVQLQAQANFTEELAKEEVLLLSSVSCVDPFAEELSAPCSCAYTDIYLRDGEWFFVTENGEAPAVFGGSGLRCLHAAKADPMP
jgi:hypothetical protein